MAKDRLKWSMNEGQIMNAATELNKKLGLKPEISVTASMSEIRDKLITASKYVTTEDTLSDITWLVLLELGNLTEEIKASKLPLLNRLGQDLNAGPSGDKKKLKPPTRAEIFVGIMNEGGGSREMLINKLGDRYGGSIEKNRVNIDTYLRILKAFEIIERDENGAFMLGKKYLTKK